MKKKCLNPFNRLITDLFNFFTFNEFFHLLTFIHRMFYLHSQHLAPPAHTHTHAHV